MTMVRTAAMGMLALTMGCASTATMMMDGFEVEKDTTEEGLRTLSRRGAIELECPADQLSFELLAVLDDAGADMAQTIAVKGCGRTAVYIRPYIGEWKLESVQGGTNAKAGEPPTAEAPGDGKDGGACYGNGTCDEGLRCVDQICRLSADDGTQGGS
jgi:hypothetical protein